MAREARSPRRDLANSLKLIKTDPLNLTVTYLGPTGTGIRIATIQRDPRGTTRRSPIGVR